MTEVEELRGRVAELTELLATARRAAGALQIETALQMLVANLPVVLSAIDRDGIYVMSQGQGLARGGASAGDMIGRSVYEVAAEVPGATEHVRRALAGETVSWHAA